MLYGKNFLILNYKERIKQVWKYGSTIALVTILLILAIPSWRVSFQGWFQGVFMSELTFEKTFSKKLTNTVDNWQLAGMNGEKETFDVFYDKPILMSFWATWCPPCRAELGEIKELKEKFGSKINFISVSEESIEIIKKSGLQEKYNFLYATSHIPSFFNVSAYPTLCIIDANQNLVFQHSGAGGLNDEKNILFLNELVENQ